MLLIIQIALGIVLAVVILRYWQAILRWGFTGLISALMMVSGWLAWQYGSKYVGDILALIAGLFFTAFALNAASSGFKAAASSFKLFIFKPRSTDDKMNAIPMRQAEAEGDQFVNAEGRERLVEAEGRLAFQNNLLLVENPYPRNSDERKYWEHGYLLAKQERETLVRAERH